MYHVTSKKWDGKNLQSAARRFGEAKAIQMFCKKWDADVSFAQSQVTNIYLYKTLEEARQHKRTYGGQILEIDTQWLDVRNDPIEGYPIVSFEIDKSYIRRVR